jgi:hypothetical protein
VSQSITHRYPPASEPSFSQPKSSNFFNQSEARIVERRRVYLFCYFISFIVPQPVWLCRQNQKTKTQTPKHVTKKNTKQAHNSRTKIPGPPPSAAGCTHSGGGAPLVTEIKIKNKKAHKNNTSLTFPSSIFLFFQRNCSCREFIYGKVGGRLLVAIYLGSLQNKTLA